MKRFIYVFSVEDKAKFENAGFQLLYEDAEKNIFIFANNGEITFSVQPDALYYSDTMYY